MHLAEHCLCPSLDEQSKYLHTCRSHFLGFFGATSQTTVTTTITESITILSLGVNVGSGSLPPGVACGLALHSPVHRARASASLATWFNLPTSYDRSVFKMVQR
jgi:hypothetical protein